MSLQQLYNAKQQGGTPSNLLKALSVDAQYGSVPIIPVPGSGRVSGTKATADTLTQTITIPPNLYPVGVKFEFHAQPTGATGTGTSPISALIQQLVVSSEVRNNETFINGASVIDYVGLESAVSRGPRYPKTVVDPVVAANATDYYGSWIWKQFFKGRKLTFTLYTNAITGLAGFSPAATGGSYDFMATVLCQETPPGISEILYANKVASLSKIVMPDQSWITGDNGVQQVDSFWIGNSNNELSGYLTIGAGALGALNNPQINMLEELWNFLASQSGTPNAVATSVGQQTYGALPDPANTSNKLFALIEWLSQPGQISAQTSTARDTLFVTRTVRS